MDVGEKYELSGRFGAGVVLFPPLMFLAAIVIGYLYSGISLAVSAIWFLGPLTRPLTPFVTFLAGLTAAAVMLKLLRIFKVRNRLLYFAAGVFTGLSLVYISWVAFEGIILRDLGYLELLTDPGLVWEKAVTIGSRGYYKVFGYSPKGALLWGCWILEAMTLTGVPGLAGLIWLMGEVFCEDCSAWVDKKTGFLKLKAIREEEALAWMKQGDLRGFEVADPEDKEYLLLDISRCERCENLIVGSLRWVWQEVDEEGKPVERDSHDWVNDIRIAPREFERLAALREAHPEATEDEDSEETDEEDEGAS